MEADRLLITAYNRYGLEFAEWVVTDGWNYAKERFLFECENHSKMELETMYDYTVVCVYMDELDRYMNLCGITRSPTR